MTTENLIDSYDERAVLVSIAKSGSELEECEKSLDELERLLNTAGAEAFAKVVQIKSTYDPKTCIGSGKVAEIKQLCENNQIEMEEELLSDLDKKEAHILSRISTNLEKAKEAKKKDNERYASLIKSATTPTSKASYRKRKIDASASHDRKIESIKKYIEQAKDSLKKCK